MLQNLVAPGDAEATTRNILASTGLFGLSLLGWIVLAAADGAVRSP